MYDKIWQQAIIPLVTVNFGGDILTVNDTFVELVGYSAEELVGHNFEKVMDNGTRFFFNSMLYPRLRMEKVIQEIYISLRTNKLELKYVMFNAQIMEPEHEIMCFIVPVAQRMEYMKEIRSINKALEETLKEKTRLHEELIILNQNLKNYAEKDWLTKLYNRRVFLMKVEQIYEEYRQDSRLFSICILDVDKFKQVNDRYGHHVGDEVLIGLANEMQDFFDPSCILARFGGEEFIILLPDQDKYAAYEKANLFRERVKNQTWQGVSITISLGINMVSYPSEISDIIIGADRSLYKAKENGRNQVVFVDDL